MEKSAPPKKKECIATMIRHSIFLLTLFPKDLIVAIAMVSMLILLLLQHGKDRRFTATRQRGLGIELLLSWQ